MTHVAFADRAGVIRFGNRCPKGALPIGRHRRFVTLHDAVSAVVRPAQDNETLLVLGVPEAKSDDAALAAVVAFVRAVETRLKARASRSRRTSRAISPHASLPPLGSRPI
jgi:hypothetical protein